MFLLKIVTFFTFFLFDWFSDSFYCQTELSTLQQSDRCAAMMMMRESWVFSLKQSQKNRISVGERSFHFRFQFQNLVTATTANRGGKSDHFLDFCMSLNSTLLRLADDCWLPDRRSCCIWRRRKMSWRDVVQGFLSANIAFIESAKNYNYNATGPSDK